MLFYKSEALRYDIILKSAQQFCTGPGTRCQDDTQLLSLSQIIEKRKTILGHRVVMQLSQGHTFGSRAMESKSHFCQATSCLMSSLYFL